MFGRIFSSDVPGFTLAEYAVCDFSCALDHERRLVVGRGDGLEVDRPELVHRRPVVVPAIDTPHPVIPDKQVLAGRARLADVQLSRAVLSAEPFFSCDEKDEHWCGARTGGADQATNG